jgi:hypothetical protein
MAMLERDRAMYQNQIKEHMPVMCSDNKQFATVDRVEGALRR